jgi:hypothetical protein
VTPADIPESIRSLADERQVARDARDFATADRLKAEIEAGGWKVVDQRTSYRLQRAYPPDVLDPDGRVRYGWSGAVPSRIDHEPSGPATVVVVAPDDPDVLERCLAGLASVLADDLQRVIVANGPAPETEALLIRLEGRWAAEATAAGVGAGAGEVPADGVGATRRDEAAPGAAIEVVWLAERGAPAAAINAGVRRASGAIVILLDPHVDAVGDFVTPLIRALDDPAVAVAGPWGYLSTDQRQFTPVETGGAGGGTVTAIDLRVMAFRRADVAGRGPLDEGFLDPALLDAWWSLVLRDPEGDEMTPRRALLVDVPVAHSADEPAATTDASVLRRNRYRLINTFGGRRDLAVPQVGG